MTGLAGNAPSPRHSYGALLCAAAAVLALVGSFQTALSVTLRFPITADTYTFTITSWGMQDNGGELIFAPLDDLAAVNGLPLMVAVAVLLAAAVLGVRIAPWSTNTRVTRVTGLLTLVGAAFLAGTVWTFGMQLLGWQRAWTESLPFNTDLRADVSIGPGFWMLVAAGAVLATRHFQGGA